MQAHSCCASFIRRTSFGCFLARPPNMVCLMALPFLFFDAGTCVSAAGAAASGCINGTFTRPCNSGPCQPTAWLVGAWGVCSKTCADKRGAGTQTRTVGCYRYPQSNASVLVSGTVMAVQAALSWLSWFCGLQCVLTSAVQAGRLAARTPTTTLIPISALFRQCDSAD